MKLHVLPQKLRLPWQATSSHGETEWLSLQGLQLGKNLLQHQNWPQEVVKASKKHRFRMSTEA